MKPFFLCFPFLISMLVYGGVNTTPQVLITLISLFFPLYLIWNKSLPISPNVLIAVGLVFTVLILGSFPVPSAIHKTLSPDLWEFLEPSLNFLKISSYPTAMNPNAHLVSIAMGGSALLLALASAHFNSNRKKIEQLSRVILSGVGCIIVLGILQRISQADSIFWISNVPSEAKRLFFGTWIYPNHAAIVIAMTFPILLQFIHKPLGKLGVGLWVVGLMMCQSRGGVLSAIIGVICFIPMRWPTKRSWIPAGGFLILMSPTVWMGQKWLSYLSSLIRNSSTESLDTSRLEIWKSALPMLELAPWTGVGMGGFQDAFELKKFMTDFSRTSHVHMEPLELLITLGIPAGLTLIGLWVWVLMKGFSGYAKCGPSQTKGWFAAFFCSALIVSLNACFDFPFRSQAILFLSAIIIGPLIRRRNRGMRYGALGIAFVSLLSIFVTISSRQSPKSIYADTDFWMESAESSEGPFGSKSFEYAIRSRPLYARAHRLLAARKLEGSPQTAIHLARHATELSPQNYLNWMNLAEVYQTQGNCEDAWLSWAEMAERDMENNKVFRNRIPLMFECGALQESVKVIRPDHPKHKAYIAHWLGEQRLWSTALSMMEEALETDPSLRFSAAALYLSAGQNQVMVGDGLFIKAWELIYDSPINDCTSSRLHAKLLMAMDCAVVSEARHYDAIGFCGSTPSLERGLLMSQLRQGDSDKISSAELHLSTHPKDHEFRRIFMHTIRLENPSEALIPHYEYLFQQNQSTLDENMELIGLYKGDKSTILPLPPPLNPPLVPIKPQD